jgi:gliding motility-associated-like protein
VEITVNPLPTVNAGTDQAICSGEEITLTATGAQTYTWDNGVTNGVAFTPSATQTYTVTGVDENNCENTATVEITVNPLPTVNAGTDQAICSGENITLTATGAQTYTWDNSVTNGVAFTPTATQTYTVTGISNFGCINSDQVQVTVHPLPIVDAGQNMVICAGESVILSGQGATTYVWDNNVVNNQVFYPITTTTYTVVGTTIHGCSASDQVTVTVVPIPQVAFESNYTLGCTPLEVKLNNQTSGNLGTCSWYLGDGQSYNGCEGPEFTILSYECIAVSLEVSTPEGCSASLTKSNYICANSTPNAQFTADPTVLTSANNQVNFTNQSTGAAFYEWDFGDGSNGSNLYEPSHAYPDASETYTVTLTAISSSGCEDQAFVEIRMKESLLFYVPNAFTPNSSGTNDVFTPVFTSGFDPYNYSLLIFNRWGELLFESKDATIGWDGTYGGNTQVVPEGVYIWRIEVIDLLGEKQTFVGHVSLLK